MEGKLITGLGQLAGVEDELIVFWGRVLCCEGRFLLTGFNGGEDWPTAVFGKLCAV